MDAESNQANMSPSLLVNNFLLWLVSSSLFIYQHSTHQNQCSSCSIYFHSRSSEVSKIWQMCKMAHCQQIPPTINGNFSAKKKKGFCASTFCIQKQISILPNYLFISLRQAIFSDVDILRIHCMNIMQSPFAENVLE